MIDSNDRAGRRRVATIWSAALLAAMVIGTGGATAAFAAETTGIENGQYSIDQVFPVQRTPAYPPCTDDTSYSSWTVTVNVASLSDAYPYSQASNGPVNIGDDYLTIVESGNSSAPWGIARFTPDGDEVRYNGSAWVTEPVGGWTTEEPFTAEGQLYGMGDEGFMHASSPSDYGNFFSNLGVLTAGQAVSYTPLPEFNECISSRAVADEPSLATFPVPGAPISRTELTLLESSVGALAPAFVPSTTDYALALPAGSTSVAFTVLPAEDGADIVMTIGGESITLTGSEVGPIALSGTTTVITFEITASNGTTRTYTVTVTVGDVDIEEPIESDDDRGELADTGADSAGLLGLGLVAILALGAGALTLSVRRS